MEEAAAATTTPNIMLIGNTNLLKDLAFDRLVIGLGFSSKYIYRALPRSLTHHSHHSHSIYPFAMAKFLPLFRLIIIINVVSVLIFVLVVSWLLLQMLYVMVLLLLLVLWRAHRAHNGEMVVGNLSQLMHKVFC